MVIGQQYSDGGVSGTPSGVSNACPGGTEEGSSSSARRSKCLFTLQRRLQYRAQACDSRQLSEKVSDCLVILSFPQTNCKQVTVDCNTHTHTPRCTHTHTPRCSHHVRRLALLVHNRPRIDEAAELPAASAIGGRGCGVDSCMDGGVGRPLLEPVLHRHPTLRGQRTTT